MGERRTPARVWSRTALGVTALVWCSACANGAADARPRPEAPEPVQAEIYVSEYGVRVGIGVGFDQRRTVTGARLLWDDESEDIAPHVLDGTDRPPQESVTLEPGTQVQLEGGVVARCPDPPSLPVFEVVSRRHGEETVDRFVPDDPDRFERAFARWCDLPVTTNTISSSMTPEGDYEIGIQISNPGPASVEVVSERVAAPGGRWRRSSVVVPGGSIGMLHIRGSGPPECAADPPWESGHLLVDGESVTPRHDGWC